MAEDVQGLLEKIHKDGIAKAQQEKEAMLSDAKKEAVRLVAEAKAQADELIRKAQSETQAAQEKANAAIRQAARDTVIALKADLLAKLNTVAHSCVSETVNPEVMKQIVLKMADAYGKEGRRFYRRYYISGFGAQALRPEIHFRHPSHPRKQPRLGLLHP